VRRPAWHLRIWVRAPKPGHGACFSRVSGSGPAAPGRTRDAHAEHLAGRAVIEGFESDLIPAGHVSEQGAKLTGPRGALPGPSLGSAWPPVTPRPVFVATA
jgi:hypothetical protein